jgi:hypothetical protein
VKTGSTHTRRSFPQKIPKRLRIYFRHNRPLLGRLSGDETAIFAQVARKNGKLSLPPTGGCRLT